MNLSQLLAFEALPAETKHLYVTGEIELIFNSATGSFITMPKTEYDSVLKKVREELHYGLISINEARASFGLDPIPPRRASLGLDSLTYA